MYNTSCANLKGKNENNVVSCPVPIFRPDLFRHQQLPIFSEMISSVSYISPTQRHLFGARRACLLKDRQYRPMYWSQDPKRCFLSFSLSISYILCSGTSIHTFRRSSTSFKLPSPGLLFFCTRDKDFWLETVLIDTMVTITSEFFLRNAFGKGKKKILQEPNPHTRLNNRRNFPFFFLCFFALKKHKKGMQSDVFAVSS